MALEDGIREFATLLCFYRDMFLYQISKLMHSFNCPYKAESMWWPCAKSVELIINHMLGFFSYVFILFEVFVLSIVFQYLLIFFTALMSFGCFSNYDIYAVQSMFTVVFGY